MNTLIEFLKCFFILITHRMLIEFFHICLLDMLMDFVIIDNRRSCVLYDLDYDHMDAWAGQPRGSK